MAPRSSKLIIGEIWAVGAGIPLGIWQVSCWLRSEWDVRILILVMPCVAFAAMVLALLHHALLSEPWREELEAGTPAPPAPEPEPEGGKLALPDNMPDGALRPAAELKRNRAPRPLVVRVTAWVPVVRQTAIAWTVVGAGLITGREMAWGVLSDPMYAGLGDAVGLYCLLLVFLWLGTYSLASEQGPRR